jgi:hypothetical protein
MMSLCKAAIGGCASGCRRSGCDTELCYLTCMQFGQLLRRLIGRLDHAYIVNATRIYVPFLYLCSLYSYCPSFGLAFYWMSERL